MRRSTSCAAGLGGMGNWQEDGKVGEEGRGREETKAGRGRERMTRKRNQGYEDGLRRSRGK